MNRFILLLLPLFITQIFAACERDLDTPESAVISPQMDVVNPPQTSCCGECGNICLLGYEFSATLTDETHPQGGYLVERIVGDCDCVYSNGEWTVATTGNISTDAVLYGGPGSGDVCNQDIAGLLWWYFGDNCGANWSVPGGVGGGDNPFGEWGKWTTDVLDSLQRLPTAPGSSPFGLLNIPAHWEIGIAPVKDADALRIDLPNNTVANQLRRIGIFADGTNNSLVNVSADGSKHYEINLSGLPDGMYQVKLDFDPGFHLVETLQKQPAPRK